SGALVVSFSLVGAVGETLAQGTKPVALTEVDSFLAIDRSGVVTLYTGKVDLGTGIATALRQIVAEELDVPLNATKLVAGDTALTPDQGKTWGSLSIQVGGIQIRNAAATARAALLEQAANRLGAKADDLTVVDGVVKVVRQGNFLGVVAESEWGAIKAAQKLKASWSTSQVLPDSAKLWDEVRASKVVKDEVTMNVGDTAEALGRAGAKTIKATYD